MRLVDIKKNDGPPKPGTASLVAGGAIAGLGAKGLYDAGRLEQWAQGHTQRRQGELHRAVNEARTATAERQKVQRSPLRNLSVRKPKAKTPLSRQSNLARAKWAEQDALERARGARSALDRAKKIQQTIPARKAQMRATGGALLLGGGLLAASGAKKKWGQPNG